MRDLVTAYDNGSDLAELERMALASCIAGLAFTRASAGYVHAIAHQFGVLYRVPHGLASAVVVPHGLDYRLDAAAEALAELARVRGLGTEGDGDQACAESFVAEIRRTNTHMNIPTTIARLTRGDLAEIARRALAESHGTYPVPKHLSRAEREALVEKLAGT